MKLSEKQQVFTYCLANLILFAEATGYKLTCGDAYRDPRVHGHLGVKKGYGRSKSCHKLRLAMDFNLFKDGQYLTETEDYRVLGEYWEELHPLARWGGHFNDGNHFSFEHEGHQ